MMRMFNTGWMVRACALLTLWALSAPAAEAQAQLVRGFSPSHNSNDTGDIRIIGNSQMTCADSEANCALARQGNAPNPPNIEPNNNNNNAYAMSFIDVDGDASTFNSTTANYTLPPGATLLWAGLYWGGRTNGGVGGAAAPSPSAKGTVRLRTPSTNGYKTISVPASGCDVSHTSGTFDDYQCRAVVTSELPQTGGGQVTVANVQLGTGQNRFGGWALVLVYRDPTEPTRNLVVYDGFANVLRNETTPFTINIPVSGFRTPAQGDVRTRVGAVVYEGDLDAPGESFRLNGVTLSDVLNAPNNFFNAAITAFAQNVTARNPAYVNNLGFDIALLEVTNVLTNNQMSTALTLSTTLDTYFPGVITFATEIYAPRVTALKTVTDLNGGVVRPADELEYRIEIENTGNDPADNVRLIDVLPAGVSYIAGSSQIDGVTRTDAADNDPVTYNSGARTLTVNIGSGATGSQGGALGTNQRVVVTFRVAVEESAAGGAQIANQADITYRARTLGTNFTIRSDSDLNNAGSTPTVVVVAGQPPAVSIRNPLDGTVINNNRPELSGDATPGTTVTVTLNGGAPVTVQADNTGAWRYPVPSALADGMQTVTATVMNNGESATATSTFTVDTMAPTIVITSPSDGATTNDNRPTIRGTSEPGATITIVIDGGEPATVRADAAGSWSYQPAMALSTGSHQVQATARDAAGNTASTSSNFTINPMAPTLTIDTPTNSQTVTTARPTISGTAAPGASVEVIFPTGERVTATADGNGQWSATPTRELPQGSATVTASLPAEANSPEASVTFTVDAPQTGLVITSPAPGDIVEATPTITGTAEPGAVITITVDGETIGTTVADPNGSWSVTPETDLPAGPATIIVTATNPDGDTEMATVDVTVVTTDGGGEPVDPTDPNEPIDTTRLLMTGGGCSSAPGAPGAPAAGLTLLVLAGALVTRRRRA